MQRAFVELTVIANIGVLMPIIGYGMNMCS